MEKITLFTIPDNELSIFFYPEQNILQTYVNGKIKHDIYKLCNEKALEYIREYQVTKIIYDQSDVVSTDLRSRAWYTGSYIPRIFKEFGSDFTSAIVKSKSSFENMTVDFMIKAAKTLGLKNEVVLHNNLDDALEWISNV